jgi:hypothetical protein
MGIRSHASTCLISALTFAGLASAGNPAQWQSRIPAPIQAVHDERVQKISPPVRRLIAREAHKLNEDTHPGEARVRADLAFLYADPGQGAVETGGVDIDALVQMVFVESVRQAEEDLRDAMAEVERSNAEKKALRDSKPALRQPPVALSPAAGDVSAPALDAAGREKVEALGESSEIESLRLQRAQDRYAKAAEVMSNVMKKMSDTHDQIIQNQK